MVETITSFQNKRLKQVRKLRDKREREQTGLFVIEYGRDLERALDYGYQVEYLLVCPALIGAHELTIMARLVGSSNVYEVAVDMMEKVSYRQNPSGLLAVMKQKIPANLDVIPDRATLCLALVNLKKPGNVGALLRTADAAGIDAVLIVDSVLDHYNPNIIRSSTGTCFVDSVYLAQTPDVFAFAESRSMRIVAAAVDAEQSLFGVDFRVPSIIALGTEDQGLSGAWLNGADVKVHIPMQGEIADSLNVSVSGAILMYEALRQRIRLDFDT